MVKQQRDYRRVARWLINALALLIIVVMGILGGCTDLQGIRQRANYAVQQAIPVIVTPEGSVERRHYNVKLTYLNGRKGPYATLAVYHKSPTDSDHWSTASGDTSSTPVEIQLENAIADLPIPRRSGKSIQQVTVAVSEMQLSDAYLDPTEFDSSLLNLLRSDADKYIPEFIVHQPETTNRREFPVPPGTYFLDYKISTDTWVLSRPEGIVSHLKVPWERRNLQSAVISLAILLNLLLWSKSYKEIAELILIATLVIGILLLMNLPVEYLSYVGLSLCVICAYAYFALRRANSAS